jgi:hypothetical protein
MGGLKISDYPKGGSSNLLDSGQDSDQEQNDLYPSCDIGAQRLMASMIFAAACGDRRLAAATDRVVRKFQKS